MSRVAVYSGPYQRRSQLLGLGDVYDPVTGQYVPSLSPTDNPAAGTGPLTANSYCFDPNGNAIDCGSPDAANLFTLTPQQQAAVAAAGVSPGVVSTSAVPSALTTAVAATLTPRPAPVVNVPLSSSTVGMWLGTDTIPGVPNWILLAVGGVLLLGSAIFGGKRR